jgi:hypothetical protein
MRGECGFGVRSSGMRARAQQLVAHEVAVPNASATDIPLVSRVLNSLQRPIATLAGLGSWCILLERALALAKAQAPRLSVVRVGQDGRLEGYQPGKHEDRETDLILIAELLGLLASIAGEGATLRIVAAAGGQP